MITKLDRTGYTQPGRQTNVNFGVKVPTKGIVDLLMPIRFDRLGKPVYTMETSSVRNALLGKNAQDYIKTPTHKIIDKLISGLDALYPFKMARLKKEVEKLKKLNTHMHVDDLEQWRKKQIKLFGGDKVEVVPQRQEVSMIEANPWFMKYIYKTK